MARTSDRVQPGPGSTALASLSLKVGAGRLAGPTHAVRTQPRQPVCEARDGSSGANSGSEAPSGKGGLRFSGAGLYSRLRGAALSISAAAGLLVSAVASMQTASTASYNGCCSVLQQQASTCGRYVVVQTCTLKGGVGGQALAVHICQGGTQQQNLAQEPAKLHYITSLLLLTDVLSSMPRSMAARDRRERRSYGRSTGTAAAAQPPAAAASGCWCS